MAMVTQGVKNLIAGISQQTPIQRYPEQLEEQINGLSTESKGLQKRPPTIFIKKLMDKLNTKTKPLIHFIDRDVHEKYIVMVYDNTIRVFDFQGKEYKVTLKHNDDYIQAGGYENLRVITVADYTFLVNKDIVVKLKDNKSPNVWADQGVLIYIKQGQYGRTYKVTIDGKTICSYETPNGSNAQDTKAISTQAIATKLHEEIIKTYPKAVLGDCYVHIKGNFKSIETSDGFNNQAMIGITTDVQRFNLLPAQAPDGFTVFVKTDPSGNQAGSYYVRYNATKRLWEETLKPNISLGVEPSTMPHSLVREADGSFTFKQIEWLDRKVGDMDSNPDPSFIGQKINDIFFYRNRLGFLANENIILSESGEYFNFFMTTASDIVDVDPIDVTTTTSRVNILNYAIPFDTELYCFSDKSQFVLRADTTLSPRNCALVEVTGFQSGAGCRPIRSGRNLYFSAPRSEFTSIKEYYSVQQTSDEKNAQDISGHIPNYIPNGVYQIEPANNENILLVLTSSEPSKLYVYKYLFIEERRVQSSWSVWDMGAEVVGCYFIASTLYLLINRGDSLCLEKMNFTTAGSEDFVDKEIYRVHLDAKLEATTREYNDYRDETVFNVERDYGIQLDGTIGIVLEDGTYQSGELVGGKLTTKGKHMDGHCFYGLPYTFKIRLSPLFLHRYDQQGTAYIMDNGRLQLRYLMVNFADTGGFVVTVRNRNDSSKRAYSYKMTARQLKTSSARLGTIPSATDSFRVPIQMLNTNADIQIDSGYPYPLALINYTFNGSWVPRTREV